MTKYNIPLNLTKFTIENSKIEITNQQVEKELRKLIEWLKINQEQYYKNNFLNLIEQIKTNNTVIKGSLNYLGRKLNINPVKEADYQPYNTSEMFRTSILTKTAGYLQNDLIMNSIYEILKYKELKNIVSKEVIQQFNLLYPDYKSPKSQMVKIVLQRLLKKGTLHSVPSPDGVLNFWATDTHYSKITNTDKHIYFSLKLENIGQLTLKFDIPKKDRFIGSKITRPNIYIDKNNKLRFGFTVVKQSIPLNRTKNYFGIDLGKVESFVGTVVSENTYSAPIYSNKIINLLNLKIEKLTSLSNSIYVKELLNKEKNHCKKYEILRTERLRIRSKISRLKVERAHRIANQIVEFANFYNANIVFEDLSWVPNSKWDQARVQEFTQDRALKKGIKVRRINAANTSNLCVVCGSKVKHSQRSTKCVKCSKKLNRDVLASRNIANRAAKKDFNNLFQISVQTRVSKPVTPGQYNHFVNKNNNLYNKIE